MMFLNAIKDDLRGRVAVIEGHENRETTHWSYWSKSPSYYDQFRLQSWNQVFAHGSMTQSVLPYTLSVVRSKDVLHDLRSKLKPSPVTWVSEKAIQITKVGSEFTVSTETDVFQAPWVFDSALNLNPSFPDPFKPYALLSGTGIIVTADRPVFDSLVATVFDPLPSGGFAYVLPLSRTEALVESAYFDTQPHQKNIGELLTYMSEKFPNVRLQIQHQEWGVLPLGMPLKKSLGQNHILMGTKRGLVKPSAGYGIRAIEHETAMLAEDWKAKTPLPVTKKTTYPWAMTDAAFIKLLKAPKMPNELFDKVFHRYRPAKLFSQLDESMPLSHSLPMTLRTFPYVTKKYAQTLYNKH